MIWRAVSISGRLSGRSLVFMRAARSWTTSEAKIAVQWAREEDGVRRQIGELASELGRTVEEVKELLRWTLPREEWPWRRKPRWGSREMDEIRQGAKQNAQTRSAVRKYGWRARKAEREGEHQRLTVAQVAQEHVRSVAGQPSGMLPIARRCPTSLLNKCAPPSGRIARGVWRPIPRFAGYSTLCVSTTTGSAQ
jgi:hypothetical protein